MRIFANSITASTIYFVCLKVLWLTIFASILVGQITTPKSTNYHMQVTLCELESNPQDFKNQEFEVNAIYVVGFEMGWLDNICPCSRKEAKLRAINYKFENAYRERTARSVLKQFDKLLKQKPQKVTRVRKILGRFLIRLQEYGSEGGLDRRYEFEIVVLKVISVSK